VTVTVYSTKIIFLQSAIADIQFKII